MNLYAIYFLLSSVVLVHCLDTSQNVRGVPDNRKIENHSSRGSGTGPIPEGYGIVAFIAFALFAALMVAIVCYKRERGIRGQEKTLFLNVY